MSQYAIGIDLGTTYSCVGVFRNDKVEIISDENGNRTMPSYVAFTQNGERLIGHMAKRQAKKNPKCTIYDAKRFIGKSFYDPIVQEDIKKMSYDIVKGKKNNILFKIPVGEDIQYFKPEEISAMILEKMKDIASNYIGEDITKAVITVPAYFNDGQRSGTKIAGKMSGLEVLRIINEPTAASIAYGLDNINVNEDTSKNILVFDLGGGTFDVSIVSLEGGLFKVLSTCGNTHLGGEDFDNHIVEYCVSAFNNLYYDDTYSGTSCYAGCIRLHRKIKKDVNHFFRYIPCIYKNNDITTHTKAMMRLKKSAEQIKRELSTTLISEIELDSLFKDKDLYLTITRNTLEELIEESLLQCMKPVNQVLMDADIDKTSIDEIVLVGGSTRIPKLREMLRNEFMNKKLCHSIHPDEAVAYGATVQAAILNGDDSEVLQNLLLVDVSPLSLGIKTAGGIMNVMIPRNSTIPNKKKEIFSTSADNQDFVTISIYEGERLIVKDNHFLGEFTIQGIQPAPRGIPKIEVELLVDSNGILTVSAKDMLTGNNKKIQIEQSNAQLSEKDITKMLEYSHTYKEKDELKKYIIINKYNLERVAFEYKKLIDSHVGITDNQRIIIEDEIKNILKLVQNNDVTKEMIESQEEKIKERIDPIIQSLTNVL